MFKNIFIMLLLASIMSCFAPSTKSSIMIELSIYPSGGGEEGYTIIVENQQLRFLTKELEIEGDSIVLGKIKNIQKKELSSAELDSARAYVEEVTAEDFKDANVGFVLDTWVFSISKKGNKLGDINSFDLSQKSTPKEIRKLIKYLLKLSPKELDLHGFS